MNLSPKEKAQELVDQFLNAVRIKMSDYSMIYLPTARQFARIVVNEIIRSRSEDPRFDDTLMSTSSEYYTPHPMYKTYWKMVLEEIENI